MYYIALYIHWPNQTFKVPYAVELRLKTRKHSNVGLTPHKNIPGQKTRFYKSFKHNYMYNKG